MGRAYVLKFILLSMIIFSRPRSLSLPFVIFHGIGSSCKSWGDDYASHLSKWANSTGYCLEIGNGRWDSWFMPLTKQIEIACKEVKRMTQLEQGFNVVGYSQGALIARGMIETCDGAPPIRNFISVAGPHAGITIAPRCVLLAKMALKAWKIA